MPIQLADGLKNMKNSLRNANERKDFTSAVVKEKDEPLLPVSEDSTIIQNKKDVDTDDKMSSRKFLSRRLRLFVKEYWGQALMGLVGVLALFYFLTMNVSLAEINRDISFLNIKLDNNSRKIERVSDDVISVREQALIIDGRLNSLNDRFALFIDLFRSNP